MMPIQMPTRSDSPQPPPLRIETAFAECAPGLPLKICRSGDPPALIEIQDGAKPAARPAREMR